MGHFETYQRYLFSGVFEHTDLLDDFDVEGFFKGLRKEFSVDIDLVGLAAYRGRNATSGIILADNLTGWHRPETVNRYFEALVNATPFDAADVGRIQVLWQLRHSIVHTGGSITPPDAQKIKDLRQFAGEPIVFQKTFVSDVARKFHSVVYSGTKNVSKAFEAQMKSVPSVRDADRLDRLFSVRSPISAWIPK
jgi:hypothetical protein